MGYSNRFAEYILAGIPVISIPQEYTKKTNLKNNCCEFYSDSDHNSLNLAIDKICSNYDYYKENSIKSSKSIDWKFQSEKLITIYEGLY
jgi:hypothetical protein